ncbi:MAG: hypothetical protein WCD76_14915 [Pyrinomonadaceae bacterium]
MKVERLAKLVERPELHRRLLGDYKGAYALGVTQLPHQDHAAALSLSVESGKAGDFPQEVELDGESVPIVVQTEWTAPRPQ